MARYHTLVGRDSKAEKWSITFGDYSRDVVEQEMEDNTDFRFFKIVTTNPSQKAIDAAVAKLNEGIPC